MKQNTIDHNLIPEYVTHVTKTLEKAGFEAFLVGGCVRDMFMDNPPAGGPKDWDITTNATPEQIIPLFEKTIYENKFGTVAVVITEGSTSPQSLQDQYTLRTSTSAQGLALGSHPKPTSPTLGGGVSSLALMKGEAPKAEGVHEIVEVTPYRKEGKYTDFRHPNTVSFTNNIEEDLVRRDFTMNALAYSLSSAYKGHLNGQIIDLYGGIADIKDKTIRAVGNANDRFTEDALRMLRAIRFSTVLGFTISTETFQAIVDNSHLLQHVSKERIRDEFIKIIESPNPALGIGLLQKSGLLQYIIPELIEGIGCVQGGVHKYDVFEHLLAALDHAAKKGFSTDIRLAALLHDIGKPRTRRVGQKKEYTFYGHEVVGARMSKTILERLHMPAKSIEYITNMVRRHMFFSDTEQITLSAVRRIVASVGADHIWELMQVREADRAGMKKTEASYRLRKYHAMIEECLRDPISVSQLKIDGNYLIKELNIKPGPRMGWMLLAMLEEVLEDPTKNTIEYLTKKVAEYEKMDDAELKALGEKAKHQKDLLEEEEVTKLHQKHGVSNKKMPARL
ncbi:MAG: CCA tRNA nucleotidyltransferase [Minisyncoccia bacterium]